MKREKIIEKTIDTFAMVNDVNIEMLFSDTRRRTLIDCRRMIYAYLRETTSMTLLEIAGVFGKTHATSLFHVNRHDELMEKSERGKWLYPKYATAYQEGASILFKMRKELDYNKKFNNYKLTYKSLTGDASMHQVIVMSSSIADSIYLYESVNEVDNLELISVSLV